MAGTTAVSYAGIVARWIEPGLGSVQLHRLAVQHVKELCGLGHSSVQVTEVYVQVLDAKREAAAGMACSVVDAG